VNLVLKFSFQLKSAKEVGKTVLITTSKITFYIMAGDKYSKILDKSFDILIKQLSRLVTAS